VRAVTAMDISTPDLVGLICGITAWVLALVYFHTHPDKSPSPTESIMGWSLTNLTNDKVPAESEVDSKEHDKFKKTVDFPGDVEKFPEGTPDFSDPEVSSESVNANCSSRARYSVDGLVL